MSVFSAVHSGRFHSNSNRSPSARLLVATPVTAVALAMKDILPAAGHEVIGPARSFGDALYLAARHKPDLAIVDLHFGGQEEPEPVGLNLARFLRQDCEAPNLFMAANAGRLRAQDEGVGCLEKPITAELLAFAVEAALQLLKQDVLSPSLPARLHLWRRHPLPSLAAWRSSPLPSRMG